jgi:maleylacetoacetate isomerase
MQLSQEAAMSDIILHDYWRSSSAYRVRLALGLAGMPYQRVAVDLTKGEQRAPDYLRLNPQGLVPALMIDGLCLTQSLAIIEYLCEVHGAPFLPTDPMARAKARTLAYAIAMEIQPVCNLRVARQAISMSGGQITMEAWMKAFITQGLEGVEALAVPGPYAVGAQISIADLCLVPQIYNARRWAVDLTPFPKLVAIDAVLANHKAVAEAHPDAVAP